MILAGCFAFFCFLQSRNLIAMPQSNRRYTLTWVAILIVYLASWLHYSRWDTNILGGGDTWGYYAYLPAMFIYDDLPTLRETYHARLNYSPARKFKEDETLDLEEVQQVTDQKVINKYTCGIALTQLPFFAAGHLWAVLTGAPLDGYSPPYIIAVHLGALFYTFFGLWLLGMVLKRYFRFADWCWIMVALSLGTNLYYFNVWLGTMAHTTLFALYCLLIFATVRFYEFPHWKWALAIGFSAGMITLIRPVELICLFIPLLYGLQNRQSWREKWLFFQKQRALIGLAALIFILMGLPQLIYWKTVSGHFFFYSYGEEGFNFLRPRFFRGLFDYKNGFLIYTPVMILAFIGLRYIRKENDWKWPVYLFFFLHLYIAYSWWNWFYINGLAPGRWWRLMPFYPSLLVMRSSSFARAVGENGQFPCLFAFA